VTTYSVFAVNNNNNNNYYYYYYANDILGYIKLAQYFGELNNTLSYSGTLSLIIGWLLTCILTHLNHCCLAVLISVCACVHLHVCVCVCVCLPIFLLM